MNKISSRLTLRIGALVLTAGFGIACGAVLFSPTTPQQLETASADQESPVSSKDIDDARNLPLNLTVEKPTPLSLATSGLITSFDCSPGQSFESGKSNISIDGQKIVNLATSVPLWRQLVRGDTGDDVRAYQSELKRLGYPVTVDGKVGAQTLSAAAKLHGLKTVQTIDPASYLWIPEHSVAMAECSTGVGARIEVGEDIVVLDNALTHASVSNIPTDVVPGKRQFVVENTVIAVNDDGTITDPEALSALQGTSAFSHWISQEKRDQPVQGTYALVEPVKAFTVAPGAIFAMDGTRGCVSDGKAVFPVTVLSSQLGQTLVTFDGGATPPSTVTIGAKELTCQ